MAFGTRAGLLLLLTATLTAGAELKLDLRVDGNSVELRSTEVRGGSIVVEASEDLQRWREFGVFEAQVMGYEHRVEENCPRFYRATATVLDRWSVIQYINEVRGYKTGLKHTGISSFEPSYLKFVIDLREPAKVYFHINYLHYSFVSEQLPGFVGISQPDFERAALVRDGQKLLLGSVFFPAGLAAQTEVGIQFVGNEPYPAEFILEFFERVKKRVVTDTPVKFLYFPEYEQAAAAQESAAFLLAHGIETSSLARWTIKDSTYSEGWAVGRLKYFPAAQIQNAYLRGDLRTEDILITDFTPADIPQVAGIITLHPSSPGSHVAILSRANLVPYVYLASEDLRAIAQALISKEILFRAETPSLFTPGVRGSDFIRLVDITGQPALMAEPLNRAKPIQPLSYQVKVTAPYFSADTRDIYPQHFKYFGGKATHFGLLRRTIRTNSPDAIAISFNLWDEFMGQEIAPGQTLRSAIDLRLERGVQAQNPAGLAEELNAIRTMIKNAAFTEAQRTQIMGALGRFATGRNIRFRSSSNVEDSATFIAAGLYDSYSGCAADDLDADETGPSACDPTEKDERGVFRAIKKVYASFYNDGAFIERRRRSVKEHEVGMALLVHHSFPDEIERANGVVILTYARNPRVGERIAWSQTTQVGAVSVTNPNGEGIPEIVSSVAQDGFGQFFLQWSSLLPQNQPVLQYAEYQALGELLIKTAKAYAAMHPAKESFLLDYEFKFDPTGAVIKQMRELPVTTNVVTHAICFGEEVQFRTAQNSVTDFHGGPIGGPFGAHYTKSSLTVRVAPFEMTPEALAQARYTNVTLNVHENGRIRTFEGALNTLPGYTHTFTNNTAVDEWTFEPGGVVYRLTTNYGPTNGAGSLQVRTPKDWDLRLMATYPEDKTCIGLVVDDYWLRDTNIVYRTNVFVTMLEPTMTTNNTSMPVFRSWAQTNEWQIRSDYFWVQLPDSAMGGGGFTSPLVDWKGTRVEGFTTEPISLRNFFSQTYSSKRKNIRETLLFDPWLEPGISETTLAELRATNIRLIYCSNVLGLVGFDGVVRFEECARDGKPGYPYWWDR